MVFFSINFIFVLIGFVAQRNAEGVPHGLELVKKDYFDSIINHVNSVGAHWTAGHNFEEGENIHHLVGSLSEKTANLESTRVKKCQLHDGTGLENEKVGGSNLKAFNGIDAWKNICPSIGHVWNQGQCASDWVIAPVSAISDKLCIASNGTNQVRLSPQFPLSCCKTCGWGCRKGYAGEVYKFWVKNGLVSGGHYHSNQGCQPYSIEPRKKYKKMWKGALKTPECKKECYNPNYKRSFSQDIVKGREHYRYGCTCGVPYHLTHYGPLTATFRLYEDFLSYKTGVYHHVTGKFLGMLSVKLVGYNDTADPRYWIAVNSWGKRWGDDGTFKIRRGVDECMIEGSIQSADPVDDNDEDYNSDESSEGD